MTTLRNGYCLFIYYILSHYVEIREQILKLHPEIYLASNDRFLIYSKRK